MAEARAPAALALAALLVCSCTLTDRPVMYGQGHEFDACGTTGEARISGDQRLEVRAAPAGRARVIYRLSPGEGFWMCDDSDGWTGIVVREGWDGVSGQGPSDDCGAPAIIGQRQPYRGPCLSGWVRSERTFVSAS
jgi:hypothetical protein